MLKPLLRTPTAAFSLLAAAIFLCLSAAGIFISLFPGTSFTTSIMPDGRILVDGAGTFLPDAKAEFIDAYGQVRLSMQVSDLVPRKEPRGTPAENARLFQQRDMAFRLLQQQGVRLRLPDGRTIPALATPGHLGTLRPSAWIALTMGLFSSLAGLWVVVLRPREWAARTFMASGMAFMIAAVTIASLEQRSLATSARYQYWEMQLNYLASFLFGYSLIALFARYPRPLVSKPILGAIAIALGALWYAGVADLWTDVIHTQIIGVLLLGIGIITMAGIQGWLSRHDPAMRASFLLIGFALLASTGLLTVVNIVPQLVGKADLIPLPFSAASFLLFYFALAFAITRYRLFDLGAWAANVALAALILLLVLAIDIAVALAAGGRWTVSILFLTAALAWLPARELLLRRLDRRRDQQDLILLRGAGEVAFALKPEQQKGAWERLLHAQFAPLTSEACDCRDVEIRSDGRILAIPDPFGGQGIALRFASQGNRLFSSKDKSVALALTGLVREMIHARNAYDRGVQAERQRIARDLHDDVGARLMTTLHRNDLETVHAGVREAMADIRLIIDGMSGQARRLSDIVADLRHETVTRLSLAHIAPHWAVTSLFDDERLIEATINRVLFSVTRELVSNIIRHACATEVHIETTIEDGCLSISVRDNGRGFDAGDDAIAGNGLINLRKRVRDMGGSIVLVSGEDGSAAQIVLPLTPPDQGIADSAEHS